jgi:pimeloyl-ACP methyl ester carboxylesterase
MIRGSIDDYMKELSGSLPDVDSEAVARNPEIGQYMVDSLKEGIKTNAVGWFDDNLAMIKPWEFELSDMKVPVIFYHGTEDKSSPYGQAQWITEHLPQEKLKTHFVDG